MGQKQTRNFLISRSSQIVTPSLMRATWWRYRQLMCPLSLLSSFGGQTWLVYQAATGVHKLTSRTSVGVLDWSCCSLALLPALTPVSCRYCWPCCRLVASTRSICSWHALKQSWNKGESAVVTHAHLNYMFACVKMHLRQVNCLQNSLYKGVKLGNQIAWYFLTKYTSISIVVLSQNTTRFLINNHQ